jgi:hypothetical protein
MSIANELSCDVATAVLVPRRINPADTPADTPAGNAPPRELTDIVLEFHSTLRQLTNEARRRRRSHFFRASQQAPSNGDGGGVSSAASGSH